MTGTGVAILLISAGDVRRGVLAHRRAVTFDGAQDHWL
jgi:hypothetical protein